MGLPEPHTLLNRAGEPGPYVLVGHSLGGAYVLNFAERFPAQVAGVALVDSMTPDQFTRVPGDAGIYDGMHRVSGLLPSVARLGVGPSSVPNTAHGKHEPSATRSPRSRTP